MNIKNAMSRMLSMLTAACLTMTFILPLACPAFAANRQFITDIRIEAGADAVEKLEKDGWSVMMAGLNMGVEPANQVYIAYKMNNGEPITNIIVSNDVGDSLKDADGIEYICAGHVDVDQGIGAGTGCVYYTRDTAAGTPLVGLDVLRSSEEAIYPITNDGAEIVRTMSGTPADLEKASDKAVVYLAQIHDGIVRPYISEIGIVTDTDKWNAVYTACERGYNYYVEGDIDDSQDTYTILVYKRTADINSAVTNITAVSADAVRSMQERQVIDTSAASSVDLTGVAIGISGIEYVRVSSQPVAAEEPYYLYQTKNRNAGNPVTMLYSEAPGEMQSLLFGTWVNGYFFSEGATNASTFSANEDLYTALREDLTVMVKLPVKFLESFTAAEPVTGTTTQEVTQVTTQEVTEEATEPVSESEMPAGEETDAEQSPEELTQEASEETTTEEVTEATTDNVTEAAADAVPENNKFVKIVMLTARDGLPEGAIQITGLRGNLVEVPVTERNERSDRTNKFMASVFGQRGWAAIVLGSIAIAATGIATVIIRKKKTEKAR